MTKHLWLALLIFFFIAPPVWAGFANYNSILIGERAAGMGGAFTALTDDPAACSFYNPATLSRMKGSSLSATANVYAKYDTKFGDQKDFSSASLRVNQGSITPIPASSGSVHTFGNFAVGLSIIFPDFDLYTGEVRSTTESTSKLNQRDESLWVGGTLAMNLTEKDAVGLTMYYTSRTYTRTVTDQYDDGGLTIANEETFFSNNGLIYILGYWHRFNSNWSLGTSLRFPYLEVSGKGSYYQARVSSGGGATDTQNRTKLGSDTRIPMKLSVGVAYERPKTWTVSGDLNYYGTESYYTLDETLGGDLIRHVPTWNLNLGGEYFLRTWLALRSGIYTNFSSHPDIKSRPTRRQGDHIDMWGLSANVAIYTSASSTVTLGGFYSGGKGQSTQYIADNIEKMEKSIQIFSFLVGTAFHF